MTELLAQTHVVALLPSWDGVVQKLLKCSVEEVRWVNP